MKMELPAENQKETIAQLIYRRAEGDRVFLKDHEGRICTYHEFYKQAYHVGHSLHTIGNSKYADSKTKHHIGVIMDNSIEYILILAAGTLWNLVICPVNKSASLFEQQRILYNCGASILITDGDSTNFRKDPTENIYIINKVDFQPFCSGPDDPYDIVNIELWNEWGSRGDNPWLILHTSGTSSGKPKGVVRSQNSHRAGFQPHTERLQFSKETVALLSWPLHSISSVFFIFNYMDAACSVIIQPGISPELFENTFVHNMITFATWSSGIALSIKNVPTDLKTTLVSGTECNIDAVREKFPKVSIFDAYGSTEAGLVFLSDEKMHLQEVFEDSVRIETLDSGEKELYVRSPMLFLGYWNNPELTNNSYKHGYFQTNDLIRQEDNNFIILGRKDDMMITTLGACIYPAELEMLLGTCVIFGHPSNACSKYFICVFEEGTEDQFRQRAEEKLGSVRRPKYYFKISTLPRTANGKIQRSLVRSMIPTIDENET